MYTVDISVYQSAVHSCCFTCVGAGTQHPSRLAYLYHDSQTPPATLEKCQTKKKHKADRFLEECWRLSIN